MSSNPSIDHPVVQKIADTGFLLNISNLCYIGIILIELGAYFYDNLPISFQVLVISISCIVIGSYKSLVNQHSSTQEVEQLTSRDAYMFPIIGSCVLVSAYVLIHYLPKSILDILIRILFVTIATFSVQSFFIQLSNHFIPINIFKPYCDKHLLNLHIKWKHISKFNGKFEFAYPIKFGSINEIPNINSNDKQNISNITPNQSPQKINNTNNNDENDNNNIDGKIEDMYIAVRIIDLITFIIGLIVSIQWFRTQHWFLNNLIGISTCIHAIAFLNPGSYYTATVLLSLLFFYDIFWVFGTDVMVTVAKNINAPIKLIFPRPAVMERPSMLGLGDIVLPGIYVALLLRYDIWKYLSNNNTNNNNNKPNYMTWIVCLICYILALGNCLLIMYYFDHAQPALLYLVPGVILPIIAMTFIRGDFKQLWEYDEADDNESNKKKN